jgi:N-acetyl-anhydromuramyl-L-alanine amidase AmpD
MWLANRKRKVAPTTIVLHATGGSTLSGAWSTLITRGLSYHYLIPKDGMFKKGVSDTAVAYHAGVSLGPNGLNVNNYSFGLAFVNWDSGHDPYTESQTKAAITIINALKAKYPTIKYLTTHVIISPGRKVDPKGYDAQALANKVGLIFWHG